MVDFCARRLRRTPLAKRPSDEALKKWVTDHGPYELCMMRYALYRMRSSEIILDYNAYFECFVSKSRVLVDFLTGRKDPSDIKAIHFVDAFRTQNREKIQSTLNRIDGHALHPSVERPNSDKDKISFCQCVEIAAWIEVNMDIFINKLSPEFKWDIEKSGTQFDLRRI